MRKCASELMREKKRNKRKNEEALMSGFLIYSGIYILSFRKKERVLFRVR